MKKTKNLLSYMLAISILSSITLACQNEQDPEPGLDCTGSGLAITIEDVQPATGCEVSDGSVTVSAEGGEGEITFKIDNRTSQVSGVLSNLAAGSYIIVAKDERGCEVTKDVSVGVVGSSLAIQSVASVDSGCKENNGKLTVTATGDGTLKYKLNDGDFQASNTFTGLESGTYQLTITDDSNCEVSAEKTVFNGTSYEQQVKAIIMTNCAISGCHNGDNGESRNWTVFSNVQNKAARIKELTQSGAMPKDGTITQEEKDLIACWVNDGALAN